MSFLTLAFWAKHLWGGVSIFAILLGAVSTVADRRRQMRSRMDRVGFMPWTAITVFATMLAVIATAMAIKY